MGVNQRHRNLLTPCPFSSHGVEYSPMFKKLIVSKTMRRQVSWLIAAILILPFILFFHATGQAPARGPGGNAGIIFGTRIPWETFQEQRYWLQRQFQNQMGEIPEAFQGLLTQYTWDRLIMLQEAKRQHVRVTNQELATFIQRIPAFQDHGRFLPDRYQRTLQAMRIAPQVFERLVQSDLLLEKLVNTHKASVTVTDAELREAYRKNHEQLKGVLMLFDPAAFAHQAAAAVTAEEIRARYDAHPDEVRIPEQLVVEYAGVTRDELAAHTQPSDGTLKLFYEDHQEPFAKEDGTIKPFEEVKERVRAQVVSEQVRKQLKALALDLQEDLEAKLRFEEMAKTRALGLHTVGPFAAGSPWVPNGPEPAVLQAVTKLREGEISEVIETDGGTYLARVTTRIPSRVPPLEEVRAQIRERLVQERERSAAKSAAEALRTRLTKQIAAGLRFEEAALTSRSALPVHAVQFTRTQPIDPIGAAPAVNETAFKTPLGTLTDVIETPTGFVIVRPETKMSADESKFSEEAASLRQELLTKQQSEQIEQWLAELRQRAKLKSLVESAEPAS